MADLFGVVRRLLWFLVGLTISAVWLIPSARAVETCSGGTCTQPATGGTPTIEYYAQVNGGSRTYGVVSTALSVLSAECAKYPPSTGASGSPLYVTFPPDALGISDSASTCGYWSSGTWSLTNSVSAGHRKLCAGVPTDASTCALACPATGGWTLSGTTCSRPACAEGQTRDATTGACQSRCDGASIDQYAGRQIAGGMAYTKGMQFCVNGCRYFGETIGSKAGVVTGATLGGGTGQACDASHVGTGTATTGEPVASQADGDAAKCIKAGQEYGTVSGKTVCTGPMSTKEVSKKVTDGKVNPDASTPSTTREETTVCKDGKCTVEVKVTNAGGGTGTGTSPSDGNCVAGSNGVTTCSKTQDQQSFCAEHPTDPQCKEQTTFGGACAPGAQPTCTGDAVQCEQARAAWKIECDLTEEPTDAQYTLGKSLATGGADPVVSPLDPSKLSTVNVTDLVTSAGAARTLSPSCIPNQTFSVMSHSYTFDTVLFCQFAGIIGYLMVAASSVIAIRMVVSGGSV